LTGILAACAIPAIAAAAPVETENGPVAGIEENGVAVFKGLPFAAPPVGDLRWRPPAPPQSWDSVRAADRFSPICM
jgi:carboxylesterase type B